MTEDELNIKYIQETTGLVADDELVPIILSMLKESYKSGLVQAEIDNTMGVIEENSNLQQRIDKAIVKLASISSDDLKDIKIMVKKLKDIKSILQGEEVKDNEL